MSELTGREGQISVCVCDKMYLITEGSSNNNVLLEPDADREGWGPVGALKSGTRRPASPSLNSIRGGVLVYVSRVMKTRCFMSFHAISHHVISLVLLHK